MITGMFMVLCLMIGSAFAYIPLSMMTAYGGYMAWYRYMNGPGVRNRVGNGNDFRNNEFMHDEI